MKTLEILGANRFDTYTKTRDGSRAVIIRDGKILLSHETVTGWWLIPGGGMEAGETPEECVVREACEETGLIVRPTEQFLTLHEYYEEYRYTSHYFVCEVIGEGQMHLTDEEKCRGLAAEWIPLKDAIDLFSKHESYAEVSEEKRGSYQREYMALSEYMNDRLQRTFPGISLAYGNMSGSTKSWRYGFADREEKIPVEEDTVFPANSISKFITAMCVMKEYEQGAFDIERSVNHYLGQWKLLTPDGDESEATIRDLLRHTAGITDGEDAFYGLRRNDPPVGLIDILEGRTTYNNRPARVENTPGTVFEYSDAGYCILQLLLEELTQKPFDDIAKELLFDRLDLKHTFFASPKNVAYYEKAHLMAAGYDENGEVISGKCPQIPDLAASGLWSTPKELLMIAGEFVKAYHGKSLFLQEKSAREIAKADAKFPWTGLGVFIGGGNEIISRGWGENGQSMMKINYVTGESAIVMTNRNPGVDQSGSGIERLVDQRWV